MLEMRPNCERCDQDLPPQSVDAFVCSFECTFCKLCTEQSLQQVCPNCGGILVQRPSRSNELLEKYPGSSERIQGKSE